MMVHPYEKQSKLINCPNCHNDIATEVSSTYKILLFLFVFIMFPLGGIIGLVAGLFTSRVHKCPHCSEVVSEVEPYFYRRTKA